MNTTCDNCRHAALCDQELLGKPCAGPGEKVSQWTLSPAYSLAISETLKLLDEMHKQAEDMQGFFSEVECERYRNAIANCMTAIKDRLAAPGQKGGES